MLPGHEARRCDSYYEIMNKKDEEEEKNLKYIKNLFERRENEAPEQRPTNIRRRRTRRSCHRVHQRRHHVMSVVSIDLLDLSQDSSLVSLPVVDCFRRRGVDEQRKQPLGRMDGDKRKKKKKKVLQQQKDCRNI